LPPPCWIGARSRDFACLGRCNWLARHRLRRKPDGPTPGRTFLRSRASCKLPLDPAAGFPSPPRAIAAIRGPMAGQRREPIPACAGIPPPLRDRRQCYPSNGWRGKAASGEPFPDFAGPAGPDPVPFSGAIWSARVSISVTGTQARACLDNAVTQHSRIDGIRAGGNRGTERGEPASVAGRIRGRSR
jgi:hypothetical protein